MKQTNTTIADAMTAYLETPTKEVLAIYNADGSFFQYLLLSEVNLITKICRDRGEVKVGIEKLDLNSYKIQFGK